MKTSLEMVQYYKYIILVSKLDWIIKWHVCVHIEAEVYSICLLSV